MDKGKCAMSRKFSIARSAETWIDHDMKVVRPVQNSGMSNRSFSGEPNVAQTYPYRSWEGDPVRWCRQATNLRRAVASRLHSIGGVEDASTEQNSAPRPATRRASDSDDGSWQWCGVIIGAPPPKQIASIKSDIQNQTIWYLKIHLRSQ